MTAPHIVDPAGLLGEALSEASPDLMRSLLRSIINALLSADADAVVGAEWGRPSPGRTAQRNGYRHRDLDTRVGTIDVAVPKLRQGTYFPHWLLERRKRAESALITVVADCYLAGVSTRRMDKLVKTLGIDSLSKSQVSRMAAELDQCMAYGRISTSRASVSTPRPALGTECAASTGSPPSKPDGCRRLVLRGRWIVGPAGQRSNLSDVIDPHRKPGPRLASNLTISSW